jgi:molybdenum storage protein
MPSYGLFERPPEIGRIPPHRTDVGAFLLAEMMGADRCLLIKGDLNDLATERTKLESLRTARSVREVFIINALVHGNILRALNGKSAGTRIYKAFAMP